MYMCRIIHTGIGCLWIIGTVKPVCYDWFCAAIFRPYNASGCIRQELNVNDTFMDCYKLMASLDTDFTAYACIVYYVWCVHRS